MSANFQLENKQTGLTEPLSKVDSKICKHLDLPFSKTHYTCGWFNTIGLMLAVGHNWDTINDSLKDNSNLSRIAEYLRANYIVHSWHSAS